MVLCSEHVQMKRESSFHVYGDVLDYCMMQPALYNRPFIWLKTGKTVLM